MRLFPILLLCACLLCPAPSPAAIYKYVDDQGRVTFVDSRDKIPPRYRDASEEKRYDRGRTVYRSDRPATEEADGALTTPATAPEENSTPITLHGAQVIVPVQLEHGGRRRTLNLLMDTGASVTTVFDNAVADMRFSNRRRARTTVADGRQLESYVVEADRFTVGPYSTNGAAILILPREGQGGQGFDGLLGMDFLSQVSYQIDYGRQMLIWR